MIKRMRSVSEATTENNRNFQMNNRAVVQFSFQRAACHDALVLRPPDHRTKYSLWSLFARHPSLHDARAIVDNDRLKGQAHPFPLGSCDACFLGQLCILNRMDPITQLQTRVEWVVTAVIDTVQLISGDTAPDPDKVCIWKPFSALMPE